MGNSKTLVTPILRSDISYYGSIRTRSHWRNDVTANRLAVAELGQCCANTNRPKVGNRLDTRVTKGRYGGAAFHRVKRPTLSTVTARAIRPFTSFSDFT